MGTTPHHGLPYPEGNDLVIGGDDAIQALAEATDATLYWGHHAVVQMAESGASVSTESRVGFSGAVSSDGFSIDASAFTYTGPSRLFLIETSVEFRHMAAWNALDELPLVASKVTIRLDGGHVRWSYDRLDSSTDTGPSDVPTIRARTVNHNIAVPAIIVTGQTIDVVAEGSPAGILGTTGLRIYPMGPA